MTDADTPRSPFAGMADLSARRRVRVLSGDEIEQMLASHQRRCKWVPLVVVPAQGRDWGRHPLWSASRLNKPLGGHHPERE
jgi:hypothetical protein